MKTLSKMYLKELLLFFCLSFNEGFSSNPCDFDVKMQIKLDGISFHRNLTFDVQFKPADAHNQMYKGCTLGIEQELPPGVYANPDQLNTLYRSNMAEVISVNRVNIEVPTEQAEVTYLFIIGDMQPNITKLWVPLHARYHEAEPSGSYVSNEVYPPRLYMRCPGQLLNGCQGVKPNIKFACRREQKMHCEWQRIMYGMPYAPISWVVPIGDTNELLIVSVLTALVIMSGTLYLLRTIHEYKRSTKAKE